MESRITPTVEGGLLTAIAVILGLASIYLPILGVFVEFFCAVPIVVLTVRQGATKGALALAASFLILSMFVGAILAMKIALGFGICGLVLGYCISKNLSTVKCFTATLVTAFIAQIVAISILFFIMGINVMEIETTAVKDAFDDVFRMYETIGVNKQALAQIHELFDKFFEFVKYLFPFFMFFIGSMHAVLCYVTSKWSFEKLRMKFVDPLPPFAQWQFPQIILYLVSFSAIGVYWGATREWIPLYTVSINVVVITLGLGFIQGLAVLSAMANYFEMSKFWRRLIFIVIIFNMLFIQIVSFTGLFDMIFDYRKRLVKRE